MSSNVRNQINKSLPPARQAVSPEILAGLDENSAKGLAKGKWTAEEMEEIKNIHEKNQSFLGGKGLTQELKDKITAAANKYGIDPKHLLAMAQIESGGNPNAISKTGAAGVFQFIQATADGKGLTNRFDTDKNIDAAARLYKENLAYLGRQRPPVEPTLTNMYLLHQQGPRALEILRVASGTGVLSQKTVEQMGLNNGSGLSAQQFIAMTAKKLDEATLAVSKVTVPADTYTKPLPQADKPAHSNRNTVTDPKKPADAVVEKPKEPVVKDLVTAVPVITNSAIREVEEKQARGENPDAGKKPAEVAPQNADDSPQYSP